MTSAPSLSRAALGAVLARVDAANVQSLEAVMTDCESRLAF